VVSRRNAVAFDGGDTPSIAGVERRSQLFLTDGVRALAHLQLAGARMPDHQRGATAKSCHDFLNIWENADPTVPLLKAARTECDASR